MRNQLNRWKWCPQVKVGIRVTDHGADSATCHRSNGVEISTIVLELEVYDYEGLFTFKMGS